MGLNDRNRSRKTYSFTSAKPIPFYAENIDAGTKANQLLRWDGNYWVGTDSSVVEIAPLGTGADDWPRLFSLLSAQAGRATVRMLSGTWVAGSVQEMPSNTHLVMAPGVVITSTMAGTGIGSPTNSVLNAKYTADASPTTLSVDAAVGDATITTVGARPVGAYINIGSTDPNHTRLVLDCTGSGPYTITLDEPLQRAFAAGQNVKTIAAPHDIRIEGNGCIITGSGDRAVEIVSGQRCYVSGIVVPEGNTFDGPIVSYDLGGRDCVFEDLDLVSSTGWICMFSEAGERHVYRNCRVKGAVFVQGSIDVRVECVTARQASATTPSFTAYTDVPAAGMQCKRVVFDRCVAIEGGNDGFRVDSSAEGTKLLVCSALGCNIGVNLINTSVDTQIAALETRQSTTIGLVVATGCSVNVDGHVSVDDTTGAVKSEGHAIVRGLRETTTISNALHMGAFVTSGGVLVLSDSKLTVGALSYGLVASAASTMRANRVEVAGATASVLAAGAGSGVWIGDGCKFSGTITDSSTGKSISRGAVTLVGGAGSHLFAGAVQGAYDVRLSRRTAGGTTGDLSYNARSGKVDISSASGTDTSVIVCECIEAGQPAWTPLSLGATLAQWFDPSAATVVGGRVTAWPGKATDVAGVAQATAGNQPSYNASGINSRAALLFDKSRPDLMPAATSLALTNWTIGFIYKPVSQNAAATYYLLGIDGDAGAAKGIYVGGSAVTEKWGYYDGGNPIPGVALVNGTAAVGVITGTAAGAYATYSNLAAAATTSGGGYAANEIKKITIGRRTDGAGPADGYVGDIVICNAVLTGESLLSLRTWLTDRAGL